MDHCVGMKRSGRRRRRRRHYHESVGSTAAASKSASAPMLMRYSGDLASPWVLEHSGLVGGEMTVDFIGRRFDGKDLKTAGRGAESKGRGEVLHAIQHLPHGRLQPPVLPSIMHVVAPRCRCCLKISSRGSKALVRNTVTTHPHPSFPRSLPPRALVRGRESSAGLQRARGIGLGAFWIPAFAGHDESISVSLGTRRPGQLRGDRRRAQRAEGAFPLSAWKREQDMERVHHRPPTTDHRPPTNDQRPTTNDQRPTTNDQRPTTNDQRPTTRERSPFYRLKDCGRWG